ncbi:hypothetical protein FACS189490_04390 [Clostridia bacterium]|nr:hypothetical protein FACS189490_04390 [Clostridia bacterium]
MRQCIDKYVPLIFRNKIYEKSVLIPNGIDKFWIDNIFPLIKRINPKNIKLIFAGNVNKNKNLEIVAKAAEYLNKRKFNIIFTIVGNVTNKKLAIKLQKYPCINLVGRVDKELLIEYYRSNDIFVMPSITESFGLVYLEAISQGLPVIYSRNQGFDGQFEEGTVGYAVSSKSVTEVVSVIKAIVNEYEKLSGNSYLIIERFDWHNIASQYYAVYKKEVCHD